MNSLEIIVQQIATKLADVSEMMTAVKNADLNHLQRPIEERKETKPSRKLQILQELHSECQERNREAVEMALSYRETFGQQVLNAIQERFMQINKERRTANKFHAKRKREARERIEAFKAMMEAAKGQQVVSA